jgi:ABC-type dipeptide/oligopeptide/nickel transport system permease component
VKNWRNYLVLGIGVLLILVSFVFYGVRVSETNIPAGSTPQQVQQLTHLYGLDRPVIEQYAAFLFAFLPGLTLLGIYGTLGLRRDDFQHWILVKIFIVLMLITNTVTILNFLVTAHASIQEALPAFWLSLLVASLALANFGFLLVIWNGYKRGAWAFGIISFVLCTLKFVGHVPVFPVLFEFSSVLILIYLLRSSWAEME